MSHSPINCALLHVVICKVIFYYTHLSFSGVILDYMYINRYCLSFPCATQKTILPNSYSVYNYYLKVLFDPIYVSEKSESRYMDLGDLMDFFFWRWTIDGNQLYIDYLNFREFHIYIYYRETLLLQYHMTRVSINNVKAL